MPDITLASPHTPSQWAHYYELRWQLLRAPWQQPRGSERDEHEDAAYHIMAMSADGMPVGVGRVHRCNNMESQIRFMAVLDEFRKQGIGSQILNELEKQARHWQTPVILLNARDTALNFYKKAGYLIIADASTLFGSIPHKRMKKSLIQSGMD